jgi:hypothetical protein
VPWACSPLPVCSVRVTCCGCVLARCAVRYQALAAASLAHPSERKDDGGMGEAPTASTPVMGKGGAGRSLKVDWSVNIGEHVFAITAGRCSKGLRPSQVDVVVIGACGALMGPLAALSCLADRLVYVSTLTGAPTHTHARARAASSL